MASISFWTLDRKSSTGIHALVGVFAVADADGSVLRLAVAHHQHVRHFLQLGFADLEVHLFLAVVEVDAEPGVFELLLDDFARVFELAVGDGHHVTCTGASQTGKAPA